MSQEFCITFCIIAFCITDMAINLEVDIIFNINVKY